MTPRTKYALKDVGQRAAIFFGSLTLLVVTLWGLIRHHAITCICIGIVVLGLIGVGFYIKALDRYDSKYLE